MKQFIVALSALFITALAWGGDTGTYKIDDYKVKLTPHSDGKVTLDYYQKWSVTGGHIPWITIGVPNSNFAVKGSKGAVKSASNGSGGGWSGVRLDLDKDYKPNESFEIWVTVEQSGLFYATDKDFKIDFTPGWYDNAFIDSLTITMNVAAKTNDVKATPTPTSREGQDITWVKKSLGKGQQVKVGISFPKTYMPNLKVEEPMSDGQVFLVILVAVVVIVLIIIFLVWVTDGDIGEVFFGGGYGRGGGIGYGGSGGGGRSSGGGGGFGGYSSSCACACVSCACACACAGGGGAGCAKKLTHSCPVCNKKKT